LKIARKFGHDKGIEKPGDRCLRKGLPRPQHRHLSATGNPKVQAGFGPLVEGFVRVPLNDIEALKKAPNPQPQRGRGVP
jgi:acetylornithine/N-succinyldiaminopimelate aminotransferase